MISMRDGHSNTGSSSYQIKKKLPSMFVGYFGFFQIEGEQKNSISLFSEFKTFYCSSCARVKNFILAASSLNFV